MLVLVTITEAPELRTIVQSMIAGRHWQWIDHELSTIHKNTAMGQLYNVSCHESIHRQREIPSAQCPQGSASDYVPDLQITDTFVNHSFRYPAIRICTPEQSLYHNGWHSSDHVDGAGNPSHISIIYHSVAEFKCLMEMVLNSIQVGVELEQQKSLLYKAVAKYSHDGIICVDCNGIVNVFNEKASEVLGVPINEAMGRPLTSFNPTAGLSRVLHQRKVEIEDVISINGRRVAANRAPILMEGELVGAISTFQDVTQLQRYEQAIRRRLLSSGFEAKVQLDDIIAESPLSKQVVNLARQCGQVDATVLVTGESGTGKEMFAQGIHNASLRARGPFVAVNCAALPETLLESELFGYEEGAFTGAHRGGKQGFFELAHGGTLFLDEIGELPLVFQARLLRVLQEREVLRVGGKNMIPIDVRVIAATNRPLADLVKQGHFRIDLFYRLYVLSIQVPPLRDRRDDVIPLAKKFHKEFSKQYNKVNVELSRAVLEMLVLYDWPGNVRELRNAMERAVVTTPEHGLIGESSFIDPLGFESAPQLKQTSTSSEITHPSEELTQLESRDREILKLYIQSHSVGWCAEQLGLHRTTVWRRLTRMKEEGLL
ncbi:MAG: sigma-54 interaction domain-containing protein, partial [Bacilli bacterium]